MEAGSWYGRGSYPYCPQEPAMTSNRASGRAATAPRPCSCGCATRQRRYPSDLTDAQWQVIGPLLPVPLCQTPLGGRPERHHRRAVVDAILYLVDNGIKWRAMPADFPPWQTVYGIFAAWQDARVTGGLVDQLRAAARRALGRDPEPSAGCIDSQSVHESAEGVVPIASAGFDPHKKVSGRKRHILTDTCGFLITVAVTPASAQDRDIAFRLVTAACQRGRTRLARIWADKGYQGDWTRQARDQHGITIDIVLRADGQRGFQVLPRRWVVERTLAWITRRRRCARDYERKPPHHAAMVCWAATMQITRRLAALPQPRPTL
jgi:transposase